MRIHILGICGTFMGGLAQILKESGHNISGSDTQFYPPMSDYLASLGVDMIKGYAKDTLPKAKTTTSYMLAHIFLDQGKDIGFLVGGISDDISGSASLGTDKIFVIEADEYDSAFFDKRSKFIHYAPSTLIINNIEFDHADIFDDLKDIKKQFHHLLKTIPPSGNIIYFSDDINAQEVINMGNWSQLIKINDCEIKINFDLKEIKLLGKTFSLKNLPLIGEHNFKNYICAILAARTGGVAVEDSIISLQKFNGVKRRLEFKGLHSDVKIYKQINSLETFRGVQKRMEYIGQVNGTKIYDDFAHHPTAIKASSKAIRNKFPEKKILGVIELASNTMSGGIHGISLVESSNLFDEVIWLDHKGVLGKKDNINSVNKIEEYIDKITKIIKEFDIVVCMTNKDSQKIIQPIIDFLNEK